MVQYQDASSGATSWLWDFGDGGPTSTPTKPDTPVRTMPGTYTVSLDRWATIFPDCTATITEANYDYRKPIPHGAVCGRSGLEVCTWPAVQFTDQSIGGPVQWSVGILAMVLRQPPKIRRTCILTRPIFRYFWRLQVRHPPRRKDVEAKMLEAGKRIKPLTAAFTAVPQSGAVALQRGEF